MRRVILVLLIVVLVMVVTALIAIGLMMSQGPAPTDPEDSADLTLDIPRGNLYGGPSFGRQLDISPDGKQIVFDRLRQNSDIALVDLPH